MAKSSLSYGEAITLWRGLSQYRLAFEKVEEVLLKAHEAMGEMESLEVRVAESQKKYEKLTKEHKENADAASANSAKIQEIVRKAEVDMKVRLEEVAASIKAAHLREQVAANAAADAETIAAKRKQEVEADISRRRQDLMEKVAELERTRDRVQGEIDALFGRMEKIRGSV